MAAFTYYRWRKEFGGLKSDQVKRKKGHKLTDAEIEEQGLALPGESWEAARARLNQMPLDLA